MAPGSCWIRVYGVGGNGYAEGIVSAAWVVAVRCILSIRRAAGARYGIIEGTPNSRLPLPPHPARYAVTGVYRHTLAGGKFNGVHAFRCPTSPCRRSGSGDVTQ